MKKSLTLGLIALVAVTSLYGRISTISAKVDFPFSVAGTVLPAGVYNFTLNESGAAFRVQGEGTNGAQAMLITRLAGEIHSTPIDSHLVFDKVGDSYFLSEIWIYGEDGYLVLATQSVHTHKLIDVKN